MILYFNMHASRTLCIVYDGALAIKMTHKEQTTIAVPLLSFLHSSRQRPHIGIVIAIILVGRAQVYAYAFYLLLAFYFVRSLLLLCVCVRTLFWRFHTHNNS